MQLEISAFPNGDEVGIRSSSHNQKEQDKHQDNRTHNKDLYLFFEGFCFRAARCALHPDRVEVSTALIAFNQRHLTLPHCDNPLDFIRLKNIFSADLFEAELHLGV